jgi:transposase
MMRPEAHAAVFICVRPVDMRKQAATLALIVEQTLKRNIFEPALYVFSNERRDRIKIVYWQRNGPVPENPAWPPRRSPNEERRSRHPRSCG